MAEVHPGTVSRALNEQTRALVNPETAERVLQAAEQLGYLPNPIARGLKTNRSFTVGVVIPDLTNPLFPPIMRGIEDRLAEAGYTALIVNTDNDADRERSQIAAMRARQVDGFIAATARLDHELLAEAGPTPLVLVNRSFEDGSVPAVGVDDRPGRAWRSSTWRRSGTDGSATSPARRTSPPVIAATSASWTRCGRPDSRSRTAPSASPRP